MPKHQKATPQQAATHAKANKHMLDKLLDPKKKKEMKTLLPEDLQDAYSMCYWADDGCYWCTDDGDTWHKVKCT